MTLNLPKLTTAFDCAPIDYPGLVVTFWLNPTNANYEAPENGKPWESTYWMGLARLIETISIPAEFTTDGKPLLLEISDGKAAYDLAEMDGFDFQIVQWATNRFQEQRRARLEAELKN
jgi:hypothetical protein